MTGPRGIERAETAAAAAGPSGPTQLEEDATDDLSRLRECMMRAQACLQHYTDRELDQILEGMVDTGCSRMVVGDETLALHDILLFRGILLLSNCSE